MFHYAISILVYVINVILLLSMFIAEILYFESQINTTWLKYALNTEHWQSLILHLYGWTIHLL